MSILKLGPFNTGSRRYNVKVSKIGSNHETILHSDVDCVQGQQLVQKEQSKFGDLYTVWLDHTKVTNESLGNES